MDSKCLRLYISIIWDYVRSILATLLTVLSFYIIIIGLIRNANIAGNLIINIINHNNINHIIYIYTTIINT